MRGSQHDLLLARAFLGLRLQLSSNFRTKDNTDEALKIFWQNIKTTLDEFLKSVHKPLLNTLTL
jgi:hypothetical protein